MIGGLLKSTSVAALAAAGIMMGGLAANAADLGGNCCADLEERVAELEATTARKGNRKVSLTVYGQINEVVLFFDDSLESNVYVASNNYSRSRFGFRGEAKINADWSAGFLLEIGSRQANNSGDLSATVANDPTGLDVRHEALYVRSSTFGTVWLGHTSVAVDGIADVCLGCTPDNTIERSLGFGSFQTVVGGAYTGVTIAGHTGGTNVASGRSRDNIIRYISPTIAGFVVSSDWGDDDAWSVALRYAGEFGAFRVAGGIGYEDHKNVTGIVTATATPVDQESWGGSLSVQHTPTGLFIAGQYGSRQNDLITGVGESKDTDQWSVVGGIGAKWTSLGTSTWWARYGQYDGPGGGTYAATAGGGLGGLTVAESSTDIISVGFNQTIDAAAMDLFVHYDHVSGDTRSTTGVSRSFEDMHFVTMGAIIRF